MWLIINSVETAQKQSRYSINSTKNINQIISQVKEYIPQDTSKSIYFLIVVDSSCS